MSRVSFVMVLFEESIAVILALRFLEYAVDTLRTSKTVGECWRAEVQRAAQPYLMHVAFADADT